jgi:hypothetical protein
MSELAWIGDLARARHVRYDDALLAGDIDADTRWCAYAVW